MDPFMWNVGYFVLGCAMTVAVGKWTTDQMTEVVRKLPAEFVTAIRDSEKVKLTIADLEELIHGQGFYPMGGGLGTDDCPKCGGPVEHQGHEAIDHKHDDAYRWVDMKCSRCDWTHSVEF